MNSPEKKRTKEEPDWTKVFKPPFSYDEHGQTIVDANEAQCLDVRGWGRAQYLKGGQEMQDAFGRFVADLLNKSIGQFSQVDKWIDVKERYPEIIEDGESELVLCTGHKGTHPDWRKYEIMRWTKLDKPDLKNHKGEWIEYGWSNRWWDTNPDLYDVTHWKPLLPPT